MRSKITPSAIPAFSAGGSEEKYTTPGEFLSIKDSSLIKRILRGGNSPGSNSLGERSDISLVHNFLGEYFPGPFFRGHLTGVVRDCPGAILPGGVHRGGCIHRGWQLLEGYLLGGNFLRTISEWLFPSNVSLFEYTILQCRDGYLLNVRNVL